MFSNIKTKLNFFLLETLMLTYVIFNLHNLVYTCLLPLLKKMKIVCGLKFLMIPLQMIWHNIFWSLKPHVIWNFSMVFFFPNFHSNICFFSTNVSTIDYFLFFVINSSFISTFDILEPQLDSNYRIFLLTLLLSKSIPLFTCHYVSTYSSFF